jgi:hypothetical protein
MVALLDICAGLVGRDYPSLRIVTVRAGPVALRLGGVLHHTEKPLDEDT